MKVTNYLKTKAGLVCFYASRKNIPLISAPGFTENKQVSKNFQV